MKKGVLILLFLIILASCTKEKFPLESKYYNNPSFEEITTKELLELEKNQESFLVMVYTTGCFSCMDFEEVLTNFTTENNLQVFRINITNIKDTKLANINYDNNLDISI